MRAAVASNKRFRSATTTSPDRQVSQKMAAESVSPPADGCPPPKRFMQPNGAKQRRGRREFAAACKRSLRRKHQCSRSRSFCAPMICPRLPAKADCLCTVLTPAEAQGFSALQGTLSRRIHQTKHGIALKSGWNSCAAYLKNANGADAAGLSEVIFRTAPNVWREMGKAAQKSSSKAEITLHVTAEVQRVKRRTFRFLSNSRCIL